MREPAEMFVVMGGMTADRHAALSRSTGHRRNDSSSDEQWSKKGDEATTI